MKLLKYFWSGSFSAFAKPFKDNEALYKQARSFWNTLESFSWMLPIIFLAVGILVAVFYYTSYNTKPGRHYRPAHWWAFLLVTFLIVLVTTLCSEVFIAKPRLQGAFMLEMRIALANALYSAIIYLFTSFVWCNSPLPTNAYRYLKMKKS